MKIIEQNSRQEIIWNFRRLLFLERYKIIRLGDNVDLEGVSREVLELLITVEIVQTGKNTSFEFGRYTMLV